MFNLKCENKAGNVIDFSREDKYVLTNVDGLNPPKSSIVIDAIPNIDGGLYRTSKMQTRNIVLTFAVKAPIEQNRLDAYRVFRSKQYIKVYIQTRALNVYTEGYVESIECNNFTKGQKIQVSIICPDSYFRNINTLTTNFNIDVDSLSFPFSTMEGNPVPLNDTINATDGNNNEIIVFNTGDSETGMEIILKPKTGYVLFNIMIKNIETGGYIYIANGLSSILSEYITINTNKGKKGITQTYLNPENNEWLTIPIVEACVINEWLEVQAGENRFTITVDILPEGYVTFEDGVNKVTPNAVNPAITDYISIRNQATRYASASKLEAQINISEKWQGV